MKRNILFCMAAAGLSLLPTCQVRAQEKSGSEIKLGGYLQTDDRVRLKQGHDFTWHEYRLDLKAEVKPIEKAHFYSELWLRSWGIPNVQNSSDLTDKDKVSPWGLDLREAYVDLYGFPVNNLDVRAGRQRITWGTADKLNPTDNLNPNDLEDIWDFGRHLGSDGLKASCYARGFTFTLGYFPLFTPAVLPKGDLSSALYPSMELPMGLTLKNNTDTVVLPENNFKESSTAGVKVSKNLLGYDLSLSYVRGRDDLPLPRKVTFTPTGIPGEVDIVSELIYPKRNIAGIDMAGAIAGVGVWSEAAIFFPEKVTMITDLSAFGMGVQPSVALDDRPYTRYVIGTDYTFKNGIYINSQYLHGFIHERGADNLHDYFVFRMERKYLDEKLKLSPIGGGVEIDDFKDIKNNYAIIGSPEISYRPIDNSEITLSVRLLDGKATTTFGKLKGKDELLFKVKYSF